MLCLLYTLLPVWCLLSYDCDQEPIVCTAGSSAADEDVCHE
jgi:hypothetical protein